MGSPKRKLSTHTFFAAEEEDDVVMIVSPLSPSPHKKRSRKSGDTTATEVSAWSNVADDSGISADSQLNDHSSEEIIAETEATINSSGYLVETPNNHPNDALTESPPDPSHPIPAPNDPSLAHISADSPTPIDPHIDLNIVPRIDAHRNVPSDPGNNPNNDPSNVTPSDRSNDTPSDPGSVCLSNPTPDHLRNLSLSYPSEASFESCPPWQRATSSIRDRFKMIFDKCEFSDCSVCCVYGEKQKTFSCHKVVLSMTSAKLSSLLLMKTNICIDLKPEVFEVLLQYMYLDSFVMPSVEAACDIYKAALHYDIPHLLKLTRECMLNKITPDNFWRSFELALDCDDKQLATGCCDFLAVHPSLWDTFSNVKKPLVRFIVDMETLNVSEKTILKAIDAWAVEQCRQAGIVPNHFSKREFIDPEIMAKIRFLVITPQDFVAYCSGKDSFLTKEEMLSILCCLTVPHSSKLPSWVCSQTTSRGISEMFRVKRKKRLSKPLQWEVGRPEDSSKDALALGGPTKSYPVGSKRFTTYFTTNKTIILRGVQVPGLWYPPFNQEGNTSYEENYTIEVRDPENKLLSGAIVTLDVPFASQVDIIFKDRISLNAHVEYSINISTCQTYFLTNHLRATVVTEDVQFHFKDSVMAERKSYRAVSNSVFEDATQCSFVIQIMFSLYI